MVIKTGVGAGVKEEWDKGETSEKKVYEMGEKLRKEKWKNGIITYCCRTDKFSRSDSKDVDIEVYCRDLRSDAVEIQVKSSDPGETEENRLMKRGIYLVVYPFSRDGRSIEKQIKDIINREIEIKRERRERRKGG